MSGTLLSFSAMALSIRGLAGALSIIEILTIRSGAAVIILLALALLRPELRHGFRPQHMGINIARSAVHFGAQYCWALSLTLLPLATVFALEFTMPVWMAMMALVILGERMTPSRAGVVVLGLIGTLIILRPGLQAFQPAALLVLLAALGYALFNVLTKKLTANAGTFAIVFWMNAIQAPMGLAASDPLFLGKLGAAQIPALVGIAVAGLSAHYCLANALRAGDATIVMPIDFLRVPLIALVGWWFFDERLDVFVFVGGAVMLSGILWNLRDEAKKAHRRAEDADSGRSH
ncbi:MAG: DMT family transporter [Pseudorhodoplanes sp.]|nr:DMT family transporter [Pseudorhodoplanes sp.]